ncbi:hypothetical protein HW555_004121 [Spodoptera exigua]|uniref:C2H2-type domain-containing protein n=1 Tax=Spodoptera exigua TaxID=7107 RepID=A0A835GM07_SPOEX|nr:hypothetical protein HW555_004121 [Spodoptera exigua]
MLKMSDEIDIEEHDILNDPSIKNIFPDLSVVKKELNEYYAEEKNVCEDTQLKKAVIKKEQQATHSTNNNVPDIANPSQGVDYEQEKVVIKKEVDTSQSLIYNNELDIAKTLQATENDTGLRKFNENIIVLGSKPTTKCDNKKSDGIDKVAKLQLKKIDSFLGSCKRYCKECQILFPKANLFNLHKINRHRKRELIRVNTQRLHETPKRVEMNDSSSKMSVDQHPQGDDSTELSCFHCKQIFPNKSCLIEHLYKVLEPNEINSNNSPTASTTNDKNNDEKYSSSQSLDESENNLEKSDTKQLKTKQVKDKNKHTINKTNKNTFPLRVVQDRKVINKNNAEDNVRKKGCVDDSSVEIDDGLFYKCFICSKYNVTFKHYSRHIITDHNIQPPMKVKKVLFDPKCKFCSSKIINMKYYNVHLYKCHKQQLKGVNFRPDKNKVRRKSDMFALKSVVFKCMKCRLFFLSSNAATNHSIHRLSNATKCSKCQRSFNSEYMALHKDQHSLSETLTVHTLSKSASNSILYKCSGCAIHYSEESFLEHNPKCHSDTPSSSNCKICDIRINSNDLKVHNLNHKKRKMVYTDFIIIESEIIANKAPKLKKDTKKPQMLFCKTCDCFMVKTNILHWEEKCSHLKKTICKDCGLVMTSSSHVIHKKAHKNKYMNLYDFTFIDIKSKKLITPPIPVYPKCNTCDVHFLRKSAIQTHTCHEQNYITCSLCSIKLTEHAYKLHMPFHSYSKPDTIRSLENTVSL